MDAEPNPGESDGELPGVEQVRSSDPSREAGVQHPEGVQALLTGAEEREVPVHVQGVPPDLPLDQERVWARLLQKMIATNQKSSHQLQINIESQTHIIKRTVTTKSLDF